LIYSNSSSYETDVLALLLLKPAI